MMWSFRIPLSIICLHFDLLKYANLKLQLKIRTVVSITDKIILDTTAVEFRIMQHGLCCNCNTLLIGFVRLWGLDWAMYKRQ